jgi:O-Antigen ligase
MTAAYALAVLLAYGVLTIWVEDRVAWAVFQTGIYALAAWRVFRAPRFSSHWALAPLAAAAAWPLLQVALGSSLSRAATVVEGLNWAVFLLVFALSLDVLAEPLARRRFLTILVAFGTALALLSILQNYSSRGLIFWLFPSGYHEDVMGPFVNHGQFAVWVELLFPIALWLAATERRLRPVFACAAVVLFSSVIASASRAGSVLVTGEAVLVAGALMARHAAPRKALALQAFQFVALAAMAIAITGWQTLESRLEVRQPEAIRVDALRASLDMVRAKPWTGSGLGTWSTVYPRYASFDAGVFLNQAHNDWAQWAAEGGLPFALFLAVFAALLCKPAVQSIYGVGTVAFLLHAFVDYPMQQRPALAAWFFAIAGAAIATRNRRSPPYDGPLRRTGTGAHGLDRGDPAGLQTPGAVTPSRPLPR